MMFQVVPSVPMFRKQISSVSTKKTFFSMPLTVLNKQQDCILKQANGRSFLVTKVVSENKAPVEVVMYELRNSAPLIRPWKEINELLDTGELVVEKKD
jgi:hypothetical protein